MPKDRANQMDRPQKSKKTAVFVIDSALLEELGERLVSRPEIALAELIKNASDADSPDCNVSLQSKRSSLTIVDHGLGMTEEKFLTRWMTIGTRNKAQARVSEKYHRPYSGSKGVGRFAARFLGDRLTLTSVAVDSKRKTTTTLTAVFNWKESTQVGSIQEFQIPYTVVDTPGAVSGTTLLIEGGDEIARVASNLKIVKSAVFKLTDPLTGLEKPWFFDDKAKQKHKSDPGFSIVFEGEDDSALADHKTLLAKLLDRFVARATVKLEQQTAKIRITFKDKGTVYDKKIDLTEYYPTWNINTPAFLDIRYFPKRKGVFSDADVDGRQALNWLRENGGVAIVENSFRVVPYGQSGDDWLLLDGDSARNRRRWRSRLTAALFPMLAAASKAARDNPMLYLPQTAQLIGAVFVAPDKSARSDSPDDNLIQAINRQGYLENRAFRRVRSLARASVEMIAHFDHAIAREVEEDKYRQDIKTAKGDLAVAIKQIAASSDIAPEEKERLVTQLRSAQLRVSDTEKYNDQVRDSLEQMSLLGVLAGFLTHEFEKTVFKLEGAVSLISKISKKHAELEPQLEELKKSKKTLSSYLDYSRLFTTAVGEGRVAPFDALAQIGLVTDTLQDYKKKHDIGLEVEGSDDLEITNVPLAAYSGIVMNLVTNAYKAVVAKSDGSDRKVLITASLAGATHALTISDTGIGIPRTLRSRIWDPLYSTTRQDTTSLGSGMGLGLTLVRKVVKNLTGKIELLETPVKGFSTSFRLELPINKGS